MLAQRDIAEYRRSGVIYRLPLLTGAQLARTRAGFAEIERALPGPVTRFDYAHLFFRWAYDLATHPKLLDAMEALIGPDLLVWGSLIANKPARSGFNFAWHQDSAFCRFLGDSPAATAWIALTDSTALNGCLKVQPGTQSRELAHATVASDDNILLQKQQVADPVDESGTVDILLKAGEMSIQHLSLLHRSSPNRSDAPRTGFILRFATPRMIASPYPVLRARGAADCAHLDLWPAPEDDDIARGLPERAALVARLESRAS